MYFQPCQVQTMSVYYILPSSDYVSILHTSKFSHKCFCTLLTTGNHRHLYEESDDPTQISTLTAKWLPTKEAIELSANLILSFIHGLYSIPTGFCSRWVVILSEYKEEVKLLPVRSCTWKLRSHRHQSIDNYHYVCNHHLLFTFLLDNYVFFAVNAFLLMV